MSSRAPEQAGEEAPARRCAFCAIKEEEIIAENSLAVGLTATYPVSPGHALIVPRRHEADFFALTDQEKAAVWALVDPVRESVDEAVHPDAYNLGLNNGAAAGQTVPHAHLHMIPRFSGDVPDPRGGVRWVLPQTARYW